jgi:hypothetical protein
MNFQPKQRLKPQQAPTLEDRADALAERAMRFVAPGRIDGLMRQWLKTPEPPDVPTETLRSMALTLAWCSHATNGTTAFDRLARAGGPFTPVDAEVLTGLRLARFRIVQRIDSIWQDLITGETVPLHAAIQGQTALDLPILCVVAPIPNGPEILVGFPVPLDDAALAVARPFIRPGTRGLTNPVHCAELVYRHILRSASARRPDPKPRQPALPFKPESDPIDALAAEWAERLGDLTEKDFAKARTHTGANVLIDTMIYSIIARDNARPKLADAYVRIAVVIVETISLRHRHGSSGMDLGQLQAEIAATLAKHGMRPRVLALFGTLLDRVKIAPAAGRSSDTDLDRLVQRIRGLRAKTVDQGCTEPEAMAAAAKVAELLDRHGLTLNELDLRRQTCEGVGVDTGRKRRGPIDGCMNKIGTFFDCRVWSEVSGDGTIRYVFFGLPGDVDGALYLHDLVTQAFETETYAFQNGPIYRASTERRTATNSFQIGLANGIRTKLEALRAERDAARRASSGRDLVPVKQSILQEELEKLGLNFVSRSAPRLRRASLDAYGAGQEAGARFEYRAGIEG